MTPIYASKRIDLSGWYAYTDPVGEYVIWDGGANRQGDVSGLWCPWSGESIPMSEEWLDRMPKMPLAGSLDEHNILHVTGFPDLVLLLNRIGRTTDNAVFYMVGEGGRMIHFYEYATKAAEFLDGEQCRFVRCRVLPENREAALEEFRSMPQPAMAHHPMMHWVPERSPLFVTSEKPEKVYNDAVIREVVLDGGYVDTIECWANPGTVIRFRPLYEGDQYPDEQVFKKRETITLFCHEENVVGYE